MRQTIIMGLLTILSTLFSCNAQNNKYKSMNVEEFEEAIADSNVICLDVRGADEYEDGHIINAININVEDFDFEQIVRESLPKDKTIAVYCRSGRRSKKAAEILADKGYNVIELNKGFNSWTKAGKSFVEEEPVVCGGFSKEREVNEEEIKFFNKVYKGEIALKPLKVSTQIVAGRNYDFICTNDSGDIYQVSIFEPLPEEGEPEVTSVYKFK